MPLNFRVPKYVYNLPWFRFDMYNKQLITTRTLPSDISDTKDVVLTETPIPGLNYAPIQPAGGGNRKITFTVPLIKRNNTIGNVLLLKQFDLLRNQATGLLKIFTGQFTPNPKVLYYWGIGSVPLVFFVKRCNPTHRRGWVNALGYPQYSEIEIELWLDESDPIYKGEEVFRKLSALTGELLASFSVISSQTKGEKPY